jgi:hypothetical protein
MTDTISEAPLQSGPKNVALGRTLYDLDKPLILLATITITYGTITIATVLIYCVILPSERNLFYCGYSIKSIQTLFNIIS